MKVSLRTLLIVVTLVAVFCAGWIGGAKYQRQISAKNEAKVLTDTRRKILSQLDLISGVPQKVEGIVTRTEDDMVAVSLGTDDGIRSGHVLSIFRGAKFIGRATVVNAEHNQSAAKLKPNLGERPVRKGDYVTAQF